MKVVQANGNTREIGVGGPTVGLQIDVAIIDVDDVYQLLKWDDTYLRNWLETLTTRFAYKPERYTDNKNESTAAIP
jgi:hypothetical protein